MNKTMNKTIQNPLITEFVSLVAQGIECWNKAGDLVVKMVDQQGKTISEIAEACDFLTEDIVTRFEQLGRKQLVPNLMVAEYPAARHLVRLPYSEQKRAIEASVELLVLEGKEHSLLKVAVENLTPAQCRQVFDGDQIRSIGAQRAWLEDKRSAQEIREALDTPTPIYQVRGKRVVIKRPCELTAGQLAQIISEIER
jgi:hypothetical protein